MKSAGDVVEILEAFDLTGSLRDAARLAGCSPMTVARYVRRVKPADCQPVDPRGVISSSIRTWPRSRNGSNARTVG